MKEMPDQRLGYSEGENSGLYKAIPDIFKWLWSGADSGAIIIIFGPQHFCWRQMENFAFLFALLNMSKCFLHCPRRCIDWVNIYGKRKNSWNIICIICLCGRLFTDFSFILLLQFGEFWSEGDSKTSTQ